MTNTVTPNNINSNNDNNKSKMLFSMTGSQELQAAIVKSGELIAFDIAVQSRHRMEGDIYLGRITSVNASHQACFVHFLSDNTRRQGFLSWSDIDLNAIAELNRKEIERKIKEDENVKTEILANPDSLFRYLKNVRNKDQYLEVGMIVLVQVKKDERDQKGATLSTRISLPGRYLILNVNPAKIRNGVSQRIRGNTRRVLQEALSNLPIPKGMSVIARSASISYDNEETLTKDFTYLKTLWEEIHKVTHNILGRLEKEKNLIPRFLFEEASLIVRFLRDNLNSDVSEIITDDLGVQAQIKKFLEINQPDFKETGLSIEYLNPNPKDDGSPPHSLFRRFQVEKQIDSLFARVVTLKSGGTIIIDRTEAMHTIDVNSAQSKKGANADDTAVKSNLEAAKEIARQIRLRDIGGIIAIDFIDMNKQEDRDRVINEFYKETQADRATIKIEDKLSCLGLLELSRQRLQSSLLEYTTNTCHCCNGTGYIPMTELCAVRILREIESATLKNKIDAIRVHVPQEMYAYLSDEKHSAIANLNTKKPITLILQTEMLYPNYCVEAICENDLNKKDKSINISSPGYKLINAKPLLEELTQTSPFYFANLSSDEVVEQTYADVNHQKIEDKVYGSHTQKVKPSIWGACVQRLKQGFNRLFGKTQDKTKPKLTSKKSTNDIKPTSSNRPAVKRLTRGKQISKGNKGNNPNNRKNRKKVGQNKPILQNQNTVVEALTPVTTTPNNVPTKENKKVTVQIGVPTPTPSLQEAKPNNNKQPNKKRGKAPQYNRYGKGRPNNTIPDAKEIIKRIKYEAILGRVSKLTKKVMADYDTPPTNITVKEPVPEVMQTNQTKLVDNTPELPTSNTATNPVESAQIKTQTSLETTINLGGLQLIETKPQPDNAEPIIEPITTGKRRLDLPKIEEVPLQDTPLIQVETNKFD